MRKPYLKNSQKLHGQNIREARTPNSASGCSYAASLAPQKYLNSLSVPDHTVRLATPFWKPHRHCKLLTDFKQRCLLNLARWKVQNVAEKRLCNGESSMCIWQILPLPRMHAIHRKFVLLSHSYNVRNFVKSDPLFKTYLSNLSKTWKLNY